MKTSQISFSQIVRKKDYCSSQYHHKPRHQQKQTQICTLAEYFQLYLQYPNQQYTLCFGELSHSTKANTERMFCSKNINQTQGVMFDSWLQQQVQQSQHNHANSQRDNTKTYTHKKMMLESSSGGRASFKNIITSKGKENVNLPVRNNNAVRFSQIKSNECNGQSIKYNKCNTQVQVRVENNFSSNGFKRPNQTAAIQMPKQNRRNLALQFQSMPEQPISSSNSQQMIMRIQQLASSRQFAQNSNMASSKQQISINYSKQSSPESKHSQQRIDEQELQNNEIDMNNYHQQLEDITSKYDNMLESQQSDCSVEEMIILNRTEHETKHPLFSQQYQTKLNQEQEIQKNRWEQAKNNLGNILKNISQTSNIVKQQTIPHFNQSFKKSNLTAKEQSNSVHINPDISVGYSFANNIQFQAKDNFTKDYLKIDNIKQIQSERSSTDKKKPFDFYPNELLLNNNYDVPEVQNQHIQTVQSIHYDWNKNQEPVEQVKQEQELSSPSLSFEAKYLGSQQRRKEEINDRESQQKCDFMLSPQEDAVHVHSDVATQIKTRQENKIQSPSISHQFHSNDSPTNQNQSPNLETKSIDRDLFANYYQNSNPTGYKVDSQKKQEEDVEYSKLNQQSESQHEIGYEPQFKSEFLNNQSNSSEEKQNLQNKQASKQIQSNNQLSIQIQIQSTKEINNKIQKLDLIQTEKPSTSAYQTLTNNQQFQNATLNYQKNFTTIENQFKNINPINKSNVEQKKIQESISIDSSLKSNKSKTVTFLPEVKYFTIKTATPASNYYERKIKDQQTNIQQLSKIEAPIKGILKNYIPPVQTKIQEQPILESIVKQEVPPKTVQIPAKVAVTSAQITGEPEQEFDFDF